MKLFIRDSFFAVGSRGTWPSIVRTTANVCWIERHPLEINRKPLFISFLLDLVSLRPGSLGLCGHYFCVAEMFLDTFWRLRRLLDPVYSWIVEIHASTGTTGRRPPVTSRLF